jgi:hypothetical protein
MNLFIFLFGNVDLGGFWLGGFGAILTGISDFKLAKFKAKFGQIRGKFPQLSRKNPTHPNPSLPPKKYTIKIP